MDRPSIGAVIPTKNSEKLIRGVLDSLWFCQEISVVDMFSTDRTKAICAEYANVKFYEREGYIYGNFNFGLDQLTTDWVIRLDSDERLSLELQEEIRSLLTSKPSADVYTAIHRPYYLGRPMSYGTALKKNRRYVLFRRGMMRYKVESEHEELTPVSGIEVRHGELQGYYAHFAVPTLTKLLQRTDYYTECDFARCDPDKTMALPVWRLMIAIPKTFIYYYFFCKGYREGYHGFCECSMAAIYNLIHFLKSWEHRERLREHHQQVLAAFDEKLKQFRISNTSD